MPGIKARQDGYRPHIGGPYKNRLGLTRAEYLVLIQALNELADEGHVELHRTLYDGETVTMKIVPLIKKLLRLGGRTGWASIPCGRKVEV